MNILTNPANHALNNTNTRKVIIIKDNLTTQIKGKGECAEETHEFNDENTQTINWKTDTNSQTTIPSQKINTTTNSNPSHNIPFFDPNILFESLAYLYQQVLKLTFRVDELQKNLNKSELSDDSGAGLSNTKRFRRKSNQITKKHSCQQCGKNYGSQGSLLHHKRIKHQQCKGFVKCQNSNKVQQK